MLTHTSSLIHPLSYYLLIFNSLILINSLTIYLFIYLFIYRMHSLRFILLNVVMAIMTSVVTSDDDACSLYGTSVKHGAGSPSVK